MKYRQFSEEDMKPVLQRGANPLPLAAANDDEHCYCSPDGGPSSALDRLFSVAMTTTGQGKHAANFLLSCWNSGQLGAWDPVDMWSVDRCISNDMIAVLIHIRDTHSYPDAYAEKYHEIYTRWRVA